MRGGHGDDDLSSFLRILTSVVHNNALAEPRGDGTKAQKRAARHGATAGHGGKRGPGPPLRPLAPSPTETRVTLKEEEDNEEEKGGMSKIDSI